PNIWRANYQMGRLLTTRGDRRAAPFLERSEHLRVLADALKDVLVKEEVPIERARTAAGATEALGRTWEALGWNRIVIGLAPSPAEAQANFLRLRAAISGETPQTLPSANPALAADFSSYPLPRWGTSRHTPGERAGRNSPVRFADRAAATGLNFLYEN